MRILRMAALCACVILVTSELRAQQQIIINGPADMPVQLPGMGPRQPKTGTARLRGRVLSTDTGDPCGGRKCGSPARISAPRTR